MVCPICKIEFNEHTGRRPKKFCSDGCKVKFWNAFKKRNVDPAVKDVTDKPDSPTEKKRNPLSSTDSIILQQIAAYEEELKTLPEAGLLSKKRREFLNKKIAELKKQLT